MKSIAADLFYIVGALCFFIYGMKMMSDGIQRATGSQLRSILRLTTKNRFIGVLTGVLITALVQSSSATTVMTVSFVNAGLLSVLESAGIMMGANIGTTITGWIIAIFGFEVKLSDYSIPLMVIGIPLIFSNRGKLKYWGEFVTGFAILFLGLSALQQAIPSIDAGANSWKFVTSLTEMGFLSRVIFVLIGALITIVVQSSSAAMAVTLTLCYQGWLPIEIGASMILGENIGTTITAEVASLVANTNARRSARVHSLFNIVGVCWMLILMPWVLEFIENIVSSSQEFFNQNFKVKNVDVNDLSESNRIMTFTLAAFHTVFNVLNVLIMVGFTKLLVNLAIKTVPQRNNSEDERTLKFINTVSKTPELAVVEIYKELEFFGAVVSQMCMDSKTLFNSLQRKEQRKLLKKIRKNEQLTDRKEIQITEYISNLTSEELSVETSQSLRNFLNSVNDLERIGDSFFQISKTIENKIENRNYFMPDQRNNINILFDKVLEALLLMESNLKQNPNDNSFAKASKIEIEINTLRDEFRKHNIDKLGHEDYNVQSSMIYNNLFSTLERIGNHVESITEAASGKA